MEMVEDLGWKADRCCCWVELFVLFWKTWKFAAFLLELFVALLLSVVEEELELEVVRKFELFVFKDSLFMSEAVRQVLLLSVAMFSLLFSVLFLLKPELLVVVVLFCSEELFELLLLFLGVCSFLLLFDHRKGLPIQV